MVELYPFESTQNAIYSSSHAKFDSLPRPHAWNWSPPLVITYYCVFPVSLWYVQSFFFEKNCSLKKWKIRKWISRQAFYSLVFCISVGVAIFLSPCFLASLIWDAKSSTQVVRKKKGMILNGMEIKLQDGMAFPLYSTGPLLDSVHDFRTQPGFFSKQSSFQNFLYLKGQTRTSDTVRFKPFSKFPSRLINAAFFYVY